MIEILESPKHLIAMKISGSVTAADIDKAYKATDEALKANERVSFFAEVDDSMGLTIEGALKDLWNGIGQLGRLGKYYRAAVVTDKGWNIFKSKFSIGEHGFVSLCTDPDGNMFGLHSQK